jgi:DNA-binding MarR family transcriptional regulator
MLDMSGPALSRWLRSLEQKQFIQRETDPEDRRNTLVSLTKEGLAKTREICETLNEFMRNITVRMGEERLQALFAELSELADIAGEEIERKRNEKSL